MWQYILAVLYTVYRRCWKWLLRLITGKCELLRIVSSRKNSLHKIKCMELSLKMSRNVTLRNLFTNREINCKEAVDYIIQVKCVKVPLYPEFPSKCEAYLSLIIGYQLLVEKVDGVRRISYSSQDPEHENLLLRLWSELKPDVTLSSRKSKQWENIGFQGSDPATDFRGMGLLGLNCLLYLAENHKETANYLMSHSFHPNYGYSFAIVGINMTSLAFQLLVRGKLRPHFYTFCRHKPSVEDFYLVFVHLYYEFDRFWINSKPDSIMEFEEVRNQFETEILKQLQLEAVPFNFDFV